MSRRGWAVGAVLGALLFGSSGTRADDGVNGRRMAIEVGTLHVGDGTVIEGAVLVLSGGVIESVGKGKAPDGLPVRRFPRAVATPGFVDAVTQLGLAAGAVEAAEVLTPRIRAADAFVGRGRTFRGLARAGTTTIGLVPSPGNVACGRSGAAGVVAEERANALGGAGTAVFAFTAPALRRDRSPVTIAGARLLLEAAFDGRRWETPGEANLPVRDTALTALSRMSPGPVLAWADTPSSARVAAETLRAKRLEPTLVGLRAAWEDPDAVAELKASCVITALAPSDPLGRLRLPGELARRGIDVALSSGAPSRSGRSLRMALALAVANGLPADEAVPSVTGRAARALGVEARVGRLAEGLEADVAVFDGAPWEPRSKVLLVVADGKVVHDALVRGKAK